VVVEVVRGRDPCKKRRLSGSIGEQKETNDDVKESFTVDVERDVLDYDRYNFIVNILAKRDGKCGSGRGRSTAKGCAEMSHRGRASRRREVRVIVGRQRTMSAEASSHCFKRFRMKPCASIRVDWVIASGLYSEREGMDIGGEASVKSGNDVGSDVVAFIIRRGVASWGKKGDSEGGMRGKKARFMCNQPSTTDKKNLLKAQFTFTNAFRDERVVLAIGRAEGGARERK